MTRTFRWTLRILGFGGMLLSTLGIAQPPNVVFVLADDLGIGDLGCYGQSTLATPHLDRLASEGLRLTQHYAGSPVCAPSRACLLLGKHTGHQPIRGNDHRLLPEGIGTLPSLLKQAGYRTAGFGKWGVGHPPPMDDPQRHGFDTFFGYVNMYHAHNCFPEFLIRDGTREALPNRSHPAWKDSDGRGVAAERKVFAPEVIHAEVLQYIQSHKGEPFFVYYALNLPHANNEATRSSHPQRGLEVPQFHPSVTDTWPEPEKGFATMIRFIDDAVGDLRELLFELNLEENTLLLFSSDNGPHQEGGHSAGYFDSNGIYRGIKRDLTEGGIRVPFIAWQPGKVKPGVSDHPTATWDVLPTLCELAGVTVAQPIDGKSFVPLLSGAAPGEPSELYWEFYERGGSVALRQGDWKLLHPSVLKNPKAPWELYNIRKDPGEEVNLADQEPGIVESLRRAMKAAHDDGGVERYRQLNSLP